MRKYLINLITLLSFTANAQTAVIPNNKVVIGKTGAADKTIEFNLTKAGASANPKIKYKNSTSKIQFCNDGVNCNDIGSGAGGINYISIGDAESGSNGYNTYADAAGTSPVDGTGGSPSVTFATSSISPLTSSNSWILSKGATNRQGDGASYDFTIDSSQKAKVLQISFNYLVSSGTFTAGSSTTDSDVVVYIYDVTNSILIQPTTYKLYSNSSTVSSQFVGNFQTAANSTSYRLIFHVGSTSASAYDLKFDDIRVSPSNYVYGTPITDWASFTPTGSWVSNTTYSGKWRRVGDTMEVQSYVLTSGAPTSATLTVNIPSGYTIDTTKLLNAGTEVPVLGKGQAFDAGTQNYQVRVHYNSTTSILIMVMNAGGTYLSNNSVTQTVPFTFGASDYVEVSYAVPIQGWSSSVQTSDQSDSRTLIEAYNSNAGTVLTANTTNIDFNTKVTDTHGAWSGTVFTANAPGNYSIKGSISCTTGASRAFYAYVNGTQNKLVAVTTTGNVTPFVADTFLNANETFSLRSNASCTLNAIATDHWINITRSPISSIISATETVAAAYWLSANQTTAAQINFDTKEFDTHGAVTTGVGAWKFTAPVSGTYSISAYTYAGNVAVSYYIYKNNVLYKPLSYQISGLNATGTTLIKLNAGDFIDIRPGASQTITGGSLASANTSNISILRVGN